MAKKSTAPAGDDLLGGSGDDLLEGTTAKPAKKAAAKPAAPAKPAAKKAVPAAPAKPAKKAAKEEVTARSERGAGAFYMDPDEKADLAKKISTVKKAISTKELAEKYEVATWQVRRAINEVLVPAGRGSVEKVGNTLVYTP